LNQILKCQIFRFHYGSKVPAVIISYIDEGNRRKLQTVSSHWQTLSYNVVSSAYRHVQELPTYFVIIPILHILFFYSIRFGTLKSDSTHHFFRNACTKSGSLRFSQFSGCWLILSVYILMTFEFPFVRLLGVW
jgi:hypothetical protein